MAAEETRNSQNPDSANSATPVVAQGAKGPQSPGPASSTSAPLESKEIKDPRSPSFGDFYVDFLGSLVPGLFAVILAVIALRISMSAFLSSYAHSSNPSNPQSFGQWLDFGLGTYGNTGLLLVAAYVLGSVFYRQDPKTPDFKSARHVWRTTKSTDDKERLAVQPRKENGKIEEDDAQFPYYFLREYLERRGLCHLAARIPWSGKDDKTWHLRTKMFINVLKIRLQYIAPDKCKDIIRNEAHVRMATSVWYATNWIIKALIVSSIFAFAAAFSGPGKLWEEPILTALGYHILVAAFALYLKFKIERFIHYLRVRETVYVLETADFATKVRSGPIPADILFSDL